MSNDLIQHIKIAAAGVRFSDGIRELKERFVSDMYRALATPITEPQPIEAAPKDGTKVLVWASVWVLGEWCDPSWTIGTWDRSADEWIREDERSLRPTHWLPLPDPPEGYR